MMNKTSKDGEIISPFNRILTVFPEDTSSSSSQPVKAEQLDELKRHLSSSMEVEFSKTQLAQYTRK